MAYKEVPIFQKLEWANDSENECPKLCVRPMITDHKTISSYFKHFCPLLLREAWISIGRGCEENVKSPIVFQIFVKDTAQAPEGRYRKHVNLLNCQGIFHSSQQLTELDLIAITSVSDQANLPFGIISKCRPKELNSNTIKTLDPRLVKAVESSLGRSLVICSDFIVNFQLQVKKVFPQHYLNKMYSVARMTSLSAIKRLSLNNELINSPMTKIILEPSKHESAFSMIPCSASPRQNCELNSTQHSAVQSIAQTITKSIEPKIAVIQGPPGNII